MSYKDKMTVLIVAWLADVKLRYPKNSDSYKYIDHDIENITEDKMTEGCNFFTQTGKYFNV